MNDFKSDTKDTKDIIQDTKIIEDTKQDIKPESSEEFEDLEKIPDQNNELIDIFQVHPEKDNYKIVKIGRMEQSGNALIKQLTYKNKLVRIVNCLYTKDEIDHFIKKNIVPLVEVYVFTDNYDYITFSYCLRPQERDYVIVNSNSIGNKKLKILEEFKEPLNKNKVIENLVEKMKQEIS